jgi:hypothetical protein
MIKTQLIEKRDSLERARDLFDEDLLKLESMKKEIIESDSTN